MQATRRAFLMMTAAALAAPRLLLAAAAPAIVGGSAFGSYWRGVVPVGTDVSRLGSIVGRIIDETNVLFSPWYAGSALTRFNRADTGWHDGPAALARLAGHALALRDETGGAFDPTVGPLVARFGFGPIVGDAVGEVEVRADMLRKSVRGATLDLCGIAKGYALGRICETLVASGLASALIELGGDVRAWGRHPSGRAWRIAVERPGPGPLSVEAIVAPGALALATSGHWPNGNADAGLTHIIDPFTGAPADTTLLSVSALDPDAARADAFATGLAALGPRRGPSAARRMDVPALFLVASGTEVRRVLTGGFDALLVT